VSEVVYLCLKALEVVGLLLLLARKASELKHPSHNEQLTPWNGPESEVLAPNKVPEPEPTLEARLDP